MSDGFLYKLGEFKAERSEKGFTKIHNDTYLEISKRLGAEACHFYTVLSTYAYGSSVTVFPKLEVLADKLGISRSTIKRWKKQLVDENVIRAIPCYQLNGMRSVDVILFNAAYPDIPEDWDTFAPDGFVMVNGRPVLMEEWNQLKEIAVTTVGSKMNPPPNSQVQKRTMPNDAWSNIDLTVGSKMNLPPSVVSPIPAKDEETKIDGEEEKINKTIDPVVVDQLTEIFETATGEAIEQTKMTDLVSSYGAEKVQESISVIATMPEWTAGAVGALCAALRDEWKKPQPRSNTKRKPAATSKNTNDRDERYKAFYDLFPDS